MTDRLGSSGHDPRFGRVDNVQGPQSIQPLGLPAGAPLGRQARGPQYARDGLDISADTRAYYAALVNGRAQPGTDPEVALRLALVHGPNSDLFEAMRATPAGQQQLGAPAGQDPGQPIALPAPAGEPSATSTFFSRTLKELSFAWQDFANSQAW